MKIKNYYFKPTVFIGRMAAYNLVLAMEVETIYGNLGNIDSQLMATVLENLKNWLLYER